MIKLTERDMKFLLALNETGACNAKLPLTIYPKRYCRTKLEKMEKEKIIIRKYDLITLGIKGKAYLESIGVVPIIVATKPIPAQRRLARASELKYLLPNMKVFTSAEYKKENNLNRGMQFVAAATTADKIAYLIYDVPKILTCEAKTQIIRELKNKRNVINRVIIFTKNKDFVLMLSTSNIYVNELLLIPQKDCFINLLNLMGTGDFDRKIIGVAFPELLENQIFNKKQTQYIVKDNTYINLVLNNLSALDMLRSLDIQAIKTNSTTNQIYNVVCLYSQKLYIQYCIQELHMKKLNVQLTTISDEQISSIE
ncbi:hypothetical protein K9O30_06285 [Clostridium bowmanii]|uniref:hypothetical protein n=1 Tax=Clostridium bowmanii TaxID=132925 RepID=UPI001C0C4F33|nr:hypothetical protein [Clostridium bowmanii]MBU3188768.1 hypothetical protein [Clostridium bowmanii]MCA1073352.1 hypothetical protein [Clostridium bowmanii]